jgi:hypothetical protein
VGINPYDSNRSVRAGSLYQSGNYPNRGRIIAREHESAIPVSARRGNQTGSIRTEASDVQRGATFFPQCGIEMCLVWTGQTDTGGA